MPSNSNDQPNKNQDSTNDAPPLGGRKGRDDPNTLIYEGNLPLPVGEVSAGLLSIDTTFVDWVSRKSLILPQIVFSRVQTGSLIIDMISTGLGVSGGNLSAFFEYIQACGKILLSGDLLKLNSEDAPAVETLAKVIKPVASGNANQLIIIAGSGSTINITHPEAQVINSEIVTYRNNNSQNNLIRSLINQDEISRREKSPEPQNPTGFIDSLAIIRRNENAWVCDVVSHRIRGFRFLMDPEAIFNGFCLDDGGTYLGSARVDWDKEFVHFIRLIPRDRNKSL